MVHGKQKVVLALSILLALFMIFASVVVASTPPPPPVPPGSPPSGGGSSGSTGSGGNRGSGSSEALIFQPFVQPVKSSDSSVVGNVTGKTASDIILAAQNNTTIDGEIYTLTMEGNLGQKPPDGATLDITIARPDDSGIPRGITGLTTLCMANISVSPPAGWSIESGTMKLTFGMADPGTAPPNTVYYLVSYDGSGYRIYNVTAQYSAGDTIRFEAFPSSNSGQFTLIAAGLDSSAIMSAPSYTGRAPTLASLPSAAGTNGHAIQCVELLAIIFILMAIAIAALFLIFIRQP
jgi:hypothetical protein